MAAAATTTALLGCDQGTPSLSAGGKGPAPTVVWKYPWAYASADDAVGSETRGVPVVTSIRVQFDRFLAPASTVRQAICVQSCSVGPSAQCDGQCIGNLSPEYDPVDRVVVWKNAVLVPGLRYNVRLLVPANDDDPTGIRAIDGAPLEKEYTFAFTAGDPAKMPPDQDAVKPELVAADSVVTARTAINFCSTSKFCPVPTTGCATPPPDPFIKGPQAFLGGSCGGTGNCHGVPPTAPPKVPVGSVLVLNDRDGGVAGSVIRLVSQGVVATESATGPDPLVAHRGPLDVFGVNMPVLEAKNPGNSYLVYKMLLGMAPRCGHLDEESANPGYASFSCMPVAGQLQADEFLCSDIQCMPEAGAARPQVDGGPPAQAGQPAPPIVPSWVPDDRWRPAASGEYNRLRGRIRGDGMPPASLSEPPSYQNARALSAWIAAGASVTCPAMP